MEFQTTINGTTMPVLVLWHVVAHTKDDVFSTVYQELRQRKWVHESYLEAVKRREQEYPTGLNFGDFSVALPHIDIEHVIRSALVMALLEEPVAFQAMDDPSQSLSCQLAIFPVLAATGDQLTFLQAVTTGLQKSGFYAQLTEQKSPEAAATLLDRMFTEYAAEENDARQ